MGCQSDVSNTRATFVRATTSRRESRLNATEAPMSFAPGRSATCAPVRASRIHELVQDAIATKRPSGLNVVIGGPPPGIRLVQNSRFESRSKPFK
jgi:hypothetical protein